MDDHEQQRRNGDYSYLSENNAIAFASNAFWTESLEHLKSEARKCLERKRERLERERLERERLAADGEPQDDDPES